MSERGGRGNDRGGRSTNGRDNRGRGRGQNYTGIGKPAKSGLSCAALGINVYDYGHSAAADQMRTSWEKLVQHVGTAYDGQEISNELSNRMTVTIQESVHTPAVLARHAKREQLVREGQENLQTARLLEEQLVLLEQEALAGDQPACMNEACGLEQRNHYGRLPTESECPIELTDSEKNQHNNNNWKTFRERTAQLAKTRGQAFSLILGQCTQLLQDKMKQDTDWIAVSTSFDPQTLYRLIEKTTLAQTEDQYPFATVYEQETAFYLFQQNCSLTNPQWYERFNTKIDVGEAIGITRQHKALLERMNHDVVEGYESLGVRSSCSDPIRTVRYVS
jgi:hypothetical protein